MIVSSTVVARTLSNGQLDVLERHTDHTGFAHDFPYTAPAGTTQAEMEATMNARKVTLATELQNRECGEVLQAIFASAQLDEDIVVTPRDSHATRRQLVVYLREQLRGVRNGKAVLIRAFLADYATDADLQAAWGIGSGPLLNALKTRLANAQTQRNNWLAATGE
jgi:hypothetical protein